MSIQPVTKEYVIDLRKPERHRWEEVIRKERQTAKSIIRNATRDFLRYDATKGGPNLLTGGATKLFAGAYRFSGGLYRGELAAWAEATECSAAELTLLNCQYELSQLLEKSNAMIQKVPGWLRELLRLGCTAGALRLGPKRVVHTRNMDWPLKSIGKATRVFRFVDDGREFVTVGVPGMVGALSGMVPGGYSVTINYAPPTFMPGFDFGPLFLLRHVFETCDTYADACHVLSHTKVSANVLFMVCSADGRACVIERTRDDFARVSMRGGAIAVANHYQSGKFKHHNAGWDRDTIDDSKTRSASMVEELRSRAGRASLQKVAGVLDNSPVLNEETRQMMAFDPSRSRHLVWAAT